MSLAAQPSTLKSAYGKWFDIGAATEVGSLTRPEQDLLRANFSALTPENSMKPEPIEPQEGHFEFEAADRLVAFALANRLKVNGHALVWHSQCPDWFFQEGNKPAGRDLVLKRMRNHIAVTAGHFRGKVFSWDVVNEAIDDGPGYLRNSKWLTSIGEDFIAEAFVAARKADPGAKLYYNDYGIEMPDKREKTLRLIRDLKRRNAPIDGIGIQGHWILDQIPFQQIEDAILAFHAQGVKVMITELDVDVVPRSFGGADVGQRGDASKADLYATTCPPEILQRQAEQYARLFALFRKHSDKISRVTLWGLHDGRSWLNYWPNKRTNHPLLWTRELRPKPAVDAILAEARK